MGVDLEGSVLPVFDEVVLLEILDEKPHLETDIGDLCLEGFNEVPEYSGSVVDHCLDGLFDRTPESRPLKENFPS